MRLVLKRIANYIVASFVNKPLHQYSYTFSLSKLITSFLFCFSILSINAQSNTATNDAFLKTLHDRSEKIVKTLSISDTDNFNNVVAIIQQQYVLLNKIHDQAKEDIVAIKAINILATEKEAKIKTVQDSKAANLLQLHTQFIFSLNKTLSPEQIDRVKNGMTYSVMPITYAAYQDMILSLTADQKATIYRWLLEARELAMDEGSSDDKHKMFGKYKGRINNYLSANGYDTKVEEKGWQQRLRDKRTQNNKQ